MFFEVTNEQVDDFIIDNHEQIPQLLSDFFNPKVLRSKFETTSESCMLCKQPGLTKEEANEVSRVAPMMVVYRLTGMAFFDLRPFEDMAERLKVDSVTDLAKIVVFEHKSTKLVLTNNSMKVLAMRIEEAHPILLEKIKRKLEFSSAIPTNFTDN